MPQNCGEGGSGLGPCDGIRDHSAGIIDRMSSSRLLGLSAYWLATNLHWGALLMILMPAQVAVMDPRHQAMVLGRILGIGAVLAVVMPPIVGALSDGCRSRWGRRRPFMVTGVAINVAGLGLLWQGGRQSSIFLYAVGYLVVQIGNNISGAAYASVIPDEVCLDQRGKASGYMGMLAQTGTVLGVVAAGQLSQQHAGASYLLIAISLALFMGVTCTCLQEKPLCAPIRRATLQVILRGLWINPRLHPDFAWVWLTRALVTTGMWMVQPFILWYLRDRVNVAHPEQTASLLLGVILIAAGATGAFGGVISDRIGRKRVVYVSNGIIAVAAVGFPLCHTMPLVWLLGIVYGSGFGAYYSVDWALGCDVLPNPDDSARDMGVWHIAMVFPQTVAPLVAGQILTWCGQDSNHHYSAIGYAVIFWLAAGCLSLGAILLRNVRGVR